MRGKVKWFNNAKGYGFIECSNLEDIFVHYSAIKCDGYKTLNEGDMVDFKLVETAKGLQAIDVMSTKLTTA
ncbi:MAG: cold shock domain-containing protein [Bacilli bacterium]|nr:cold shock domain-containing protein [Bacilli bacterium]